MNAKMETAAPSTNTVHPEDANLIDQLARLQQMHQKLQDLRSLLPTALLGSARQAVSQPNTTSPRAVATSLSKVNKSGRASISHFKKEWHDERTRQLFKDAAIANTTDGHDVWLEDYVSLAKNTKKPAFGKPDNQSLESLEDATASIKKWSTDQKISLITMDDPKLSVVVKVENLHFSLVRDEESQNYQVKLEHDDELSKSVLQRIQGLGPWKRISDLLEILESYVGFKMQKCDTCQRLLDANLDYALVRSSKSPEDGERPLEPPQRQWLAYHDGCRSQD